MSSTDELNALRDRNKDLLEQLKQHSERLRVSLRSWSRDGEGEAEANREAEEVLALTVGDRGSDRAAPPETTVHGFSDTGNRQPDVQRTVSTPAATPEHGGTAPRTDSPDGDRHLQVQDGQQETGPHGLKSCFIKNKEKKESQRRVTFQPDDGKEPSSEHDVSASDLLHVPPLLGYDWIAAVLDSDDAVTDRSDQFFNDLRVFRSLYKNECVHSPTAEFSADNRSGLQQLTDEDEPQDNTDTHKCTFSYRINSRLFPTPLHSQECCPVCKTPKSCHPHTAADPALIRVSIPCSALLPSYEYKAHRRCSFDPSDSFGLPSHCLSGWSHTGQNTAPPPSSLDLRSNLNTKSSVQALFDELQDSSAPKFSADQILNVSRLPRHNFQHFNPKRRRK